MVPLGRLAPTQRAVGQTRTIPNACRPVALPILDPGVGQEQAQRHRDRHLAAGQGQGYQRLAVRPLAKLPAVLPLHARRVPPLLDQRRVVHAEHGVQAPSAGIPHAAVRGTLASSAHQAVSLLGQHTLQPLVRLGRGGDEVMRLLHLARADASGHRLHALALAG